MGERPIKNSKTSVIITTYNDADYLRRSIPSVINQTLKPQEIIIIDDGSDNNSSKLLTNSFAEKTDIPIIYHKKENGGPSSARNAGIGLASGEFILFLDSDDELLTNSIEWRQKILESLGDNYASVYCGRIERINNKKNNKIEIIEREGSLDVSLVGRKNGVPGQITNHIFRKYILLEVKGYNEHLKFNEDFELIMRIAKKWKFRGVNEAGFIHHIRDDSWSKIDHRAAYDGVEDFLNIAHSNKLMPMKEIHKRRKENRLSLSRKLLTNKTSWKEAIPFIDEAFDIIGPRNLKEFILFFLNQILKRF